MTYTYRVCRKCGKQVNVSCKMGHEKKYICPRCVGEPWFMTREGMVSRKQKKAAPGAGTSGERHRKIHT